MSLHPRSSPTPRHLLTLVVLAVLVASAAAYTPDPDGDATIVPVGGKDYVLLGAEPVKIPLLGSGTLSGYARVHFAPGVDGTLPGTIKFAGVTERTIQVPLDFEPSSSSTWDDGRPGRPSGGRRFEIYVPKGVHDVLVTAEVPAGSFMTAVFYYDGPSQDRIAAARAGLPPNPWRYRNSFGLEVIYDDNCITQGDDAIDTWVDGLAPEQYRIGAIEDVVIAPKLDFAAERNLIGWGKTRFRFKVKRWMYTANPIKTNTDFDFYLRQYFGRRKSLELYYHYAPEQYIRMLSDRPPFSDPDEDVEYKEFRFTRNVANITWRHYPAGPFDYSLLFEFNGRYYNKPFIENDIEAWEIRGSVGYRIHRRFKIDLDYSYEHADARGYDTVGESRENSDDGDASYRRDLYRFGFTWTTRWAMPLFGSVDGSYLFMDYYYPTQTPIFQDPYHTGRRDKVTKISVGLNRRINNDLSVYFNFRYSDRVVESPWYGDITLDKDYIQHRYWIGLDYDF